MAADAHPPLRRRGFVACFALAALAHVASVRAQSSGGGAAPDTRDMIDALRPLRKRNLIVRPATPEAAPPAPEPVATAPAPMPPMPAPSPAPTAAPPAAPTPAPAPASPPAVAEAPPSLSLSIQFESNSARVRPESGPVLGNLVAAMQSPDLKANRFVIEGHTDARGPAAANLRLSQQRAEEVRLYLVALGVHPARLKAVGKGSSEPIDPRDPMSADNRRVRVVTLE